jgi:hypothetical protein
MAPRLGEVLVGRGLITPDQLKKALDAQVIYGGHLGTCLVQLGFLDLDRLGEVLAEQFRLPDASRDRFLCIDPSIVTKIPAALAKRHQAIPFAIEGRVLKIAMVDPHNLLAIDELSFSSGYKIEPWVVPEILLYRALELHYGIPRELRHVPVSMQSARSITSATATATAPLSVADDEGARASRSSDDEPSDDAPPPPDPEVVEGLRSLVNRVEPAQAPEQREDEWLSAGDDPAAFEEQTRPQAHLELETRHPSDGKLALDWIKRRDGDVQRWCELFKLPLEDAHFQRLSGVYVVWREGRDPVLSVGQGYVRTELSTLKLDPRIRKIAADTKVYVSWAEVDREHVDSVERFLCEMLRPVFIAVIPEAQPLEVNLPC